MARFEGDGGGGAGGHEDAMADDEQGNINGQHEDDGKRMPILERTVI